MLISPLFLMRCYEARWHSGLLDWRTNSFLFIHGEAQTSSHNIVFGFHTAFYLLFPVFWHICGVEHDTAIKKKRKCILVYTGNGKGVNHRLKKWHANFSVKRLYYLGITWVFLLFCLSCLTLFPLILFSDHPDFQLSNLKQSKGEKPAYLVFATNVKGPLILAKNVFEPKPSPFPNSNQLDFAWTYLNLNHSGVRSENTFLLLQQGFVTVLEGLADLSNCKWTTFM